MSNKYSTTRIPATSMDVVQDNLEQLKALFPNVFTEGKVDFDALKAELGEYVETSDERYQFTWAGKEQAKRIATTPSLGTLRPAPEESVDWENTENLYIEGDNLEVLKLLQKSYFGKVKMIYIDPPYNTGKDFVYKDDFKDNLANYQRLTGQRDENGTALSTTVEGAGRFHSNWLSMMYPRLSLARNLLRDDGVLFVHIDEHEYARLELLLTSIFGHDNNLGTIVWDKRNPKGKVVGVAQQHEYVIVFSKNKEVFSTSKFAKEKENASEMLKTAEKLVKENSGVVDSYVRNEFRDWVRSMSGDLSGGEAAYNQIDEHGNVFQSVSMAAPDRPETRSHRPLIHPLTNKECPVPAKGWRFPDSTMDSLLSRGLVVFGEDEKTQPRQKYLLKNNLTESFSSLFYYGGSGATDVPFDNPKPLYISSRLIKSVTENDEIVIDFFSGSSTTAHAVMQLNAEDNGSRKFIMVQIPEPTPDKSEAQKAGYATIAEIGKERIRRAAAKIREEHPDTQADLGFKVLKLDSSNLKKWQPDYDNLADDLLDAVDNIAPGRSSEDLLYEVLIKYGLPLTLPVTKQQVNGHTVYNVANGSLVACFDEKITLDTVQAIIDLGGEDEPILRIVFRDSSFADDIVKTNAIQRFKQAGIDDVLSI